MITFDEVKNSNPLLIIYPAGTGGEFVSSVISQASESFHTLPTLYDKELNRYSVICSLDYSSTWPDIDNPDTWINYRYRKDHLGLRHIIKDHPIYSHVEAYKKYIPNATVIFMLPFREFEYFSKLIFIKTAKLQASPVDHAFVHNSIGHNLSSSRVAQLVNWCNTKTVFWMHELYIANTILSADGDISNFHHKLDLGKYVNEHINDIHKQFNTTLPELCYHFADLRLINCDSLATDGVHFWKSIKAVIEDLDIDFAIEKTATWISANNKLINEYKI